MGTEEAMSSEAPSATELQIIQQIEYYFGNYNLSRDKFLRSQLSEDDGWVPLETMIKFNRLKKLSEDFNVIVEALKKSPKQLMEISEDCTKIRRRTAVPVPEEYGKSQEDLDLKTLYVKGFKKTNTLDELLEYFKDHKVEHVFMRRYFHLNNKPFKGSVFVTFETKEDAAKFLETKGLKYGNTELLKEWKADYIKRKDEYFARVKEEKEKKLLKRAGLVKETENGEKVQEINIVPGCLIKIDNLDENTTREDLKPLFEEHGNLVYLDYSKGKPSAVLRYDTGVASSAFEKVFGDKNTIKIGTSDATGHVLEGDEEKEYWKNIAISRAQSRLRSKEGKSFGKRRGGGGGGGRRWGNRQRGKREGDDNDDKNDEPPAKKKRMENSEDADHKKDAPEMEVSSETHTGKESSASEVKDVPAVKKENESES